jgi:hypothetical protein
VAVASRPVGVTHIWALHGLWLVAGSAGVGYAAHVKRSLQLALELLVRRRQIQGASFCGVSSASHRCNDRQLKPVHWRLVLDACDAPIPLAMS